MSYDHRLLYSEKWAVTCVCRISWRCETDLLKSKIFPEVSYMLVTPARSEVIPTSVMRPFSKANSSPR